MQQEDAAKAKASGMAMIAVAVLAAAVAVLGVFWYRGAEADGVPGGNAENVEGAEVAKEPSEPPKTIDFADYDRRMRRLAKSGEFAPITDAPPADPTAEAPAPAPEPIEQPKPLWPVEAPYPNVGAILPFHRIIAYYGNFYSKQMGVLGEYEESVMLEKFQKEIDKWEKADPETPVMPAIDYIAVTAQLAPGKDGMHRFRMPDSQIDKAVELAKKVNGIVILEVQPGYSPVLDEVKALEKYLSMPQVHLALDPEFAMIRRGVRPGLMVGTIDAWEVNATINYLEGLVKEHNLPPKVLVVHRYTRLMLTNTQDMKPSADVQVIIDMDGWGPKAKKYSTYNAYIKPEPVQFTGFKLFYKNDIKQPGTVILTPEEILQDLTPQPVFIQFQ